MLEITGERKKIFTDVASKRQLDLTVLLENVHDPHNIGAVMRSCDSIGIDEIYILYTDPKLIERGYRKSHGSSTGVSDWVKVNYFTDMLLCIKDLNSKYKAIVGTVIDESARMLFEIDLTSSVVLVFGNEKEGISDELKSHLDRKITIPQVGFAHSLNISVACAVSLYEAYRQRNVKGMYQPKTADKIFERFVNLHEAKKTRKAAKKPSF